MEITDELAELRTRHAHELGAIPWAAEAERFTELVFCLLNADEDDPPRIRAAVQALAVLGLDGPATLAEAADPTSPAGVTLRYVLARFAVADGEAGARALGRLGSVVTASYEGRLQQFLRPHAERIRDELAALLTEPGAEVRPATRRAATHWLQNTAAMPLSVDDDAVEDFCAERGLTVADLQVAADTIGLNIAVVDDVIRLEALERAAVEALEQEAVGADQP